MRWIDTPSGCAAKVGEFELQVTDDYGDHRATWRVSIRGQGISGGTVRGVVGRITDAKKAALQVVIKMIASAVRDLAELQDGD